MLTVIFHNVEMSFFHFIVSVLHKNQEKDGWPLLVVYTDNSVVKKWHNDLQK